MKSILSVYDFLPLLLLVLQALIFLSATLAVLRYLKILQVPYAGIQYSKLVIGATMLLSAMIISFSNTEALVQAVKTFHNYGDGFYRNIFIKYSQFILVIVLAEILFALLCFMIIRVIPGFRESYHTEEDMPGAVLQAVVVIVIAILMYTCAKEVMETITPKYINFS